MSILTTIEEVQNFLLACSYHKTSSDRFGKQTICCNNGNALIFFTGVLLNAPQTQVIWTFSDSFNIPYVSLAIYSDLINTKVWREAYKAV